MGYKLSVVSTRFRAHPLIKASDSTLNQVLLKIDSLNSFETGAIRYTYKAQTKFEHSLPCYQIQLE